jgi:hypothetical protein
LVGKANKGLKHYTHACSLLCHIITIDQVKGTLNKFQTKCGSSSFKKKKKKTFAIFPFEWEYEELLKPSNNFKGEAGPVCSYGIISWMNSNTSLQSYF